MPKQKRYEVKQKLTSVLNELGRAEDKLVEVGSQFRDHESGYYKQFGALVNGLDILSQAVTRIRDGL